MIIGKTNTPEFGAGSQTFNAVFGATRNPYDLTKTPGGSQRRRGGRGRRRGCCRSPTAPTSARACATRRRSATWWACAPRPAGFPTTAPGDPWNPLPVLGHDRAHARPTSRCCSPRSPARTRATRSRSRSRGRSRRSTTSTRSGVRIAWSRDLGGLPVDPEVTAVLRGARARRWRRSAASSRTPSPTSAAPTSASRCCAASSFAGRLRDDRRRAQADAGRERPLRASAGRRPDRGAPRAARRAVHPHARVPRPATTSSPARSPRWRRSASTPSTRREIAGTPMGSYLEWFRSCSRITVTAHPALSVPAGLTRRRAADRPAARRPPPRRARPALARSRPGRCRS